MARTASRFNPEAPGPRRTSAFMTLKQKKWAHAHSVLTPRLRIQNCIRFARAQASARRSFTGSAGPFRGPRDQVVVPGADNLDVDELARFEGRRVAIGQKDRGIDV